LNENSLARFVVEIMEQLDTNAIEQAYGGGGSPPYPPKMMLALLFYCYAKGIFSTRKIEQAIYEQIDRLERTAVEAKAFIRYTERFRWPLLLGLMALIGELWLRARRGLLP
jgi:hypothetical protein